MDPVTLSTAIVALLSPYLAEAGKAAAKKTGEAIANATPKIYQAVKAKFNQKPAAVEALSDLKENPSDEDIQAAVRVQLKKLLAEDASFASQLQQLLEMAQSTDASTVVNVAGDGTAVVGDNDTVIGKKGVNVGGNAYGPINTGNA